MSELAAKAIASSPFLMQDNLADVLAELQDAFYALVSHSSTESLFQNPRALVHYGAVEG